MEEHDQYKIELDSQDIEGIVERWAEHMLKEKGYKLDCVQNVSEQPFPDMAFRGQKIKEADNGS